MAGAPREPEPLLPSYRGRPDLDRVLRDNLTLLRDRCEDPAVRRRLGDVLEGRASMRELARSPDYQRFMGPLVLEGARRWQEAQLEDQPRADPGTDPDRAGATDPATGPPPPPPAAGGGTW